MPVMDLNLLQQTLREFAAQRDWQPFHTPKNLAMALMVEAAELAEIFQWMTPEQSQAASHDKVERERIGDEVADVLLSLLQLADHCDVDLKRAVGRKLTKKYPPTRPGLPAGPAKSTTQPTHVLVDWENVQPKDTEILALVPDATDVWIFHGKQQKKVDAHQKAFSDHLTLVPVSRAGKNALDFHLSFYMGYITSRNPEARIVVIANDQGYGPMLEHAKELGFDARQVGFGPTPKKTPAKKAPAKTPKVGSTTSAATAKPVAKAATKKALPTKTAPAKSVAPTPTLKPSAKAKAPATKQKPPVKKATSAKISLAEKKGGKTEISQEYSAPDKDYVHVLKSLRKTKNKPLREARLKGAVKSLLPIDRADDVRVASVIQRLIAERVVTVDEQGAVTIKQA